MIASRAEKEKQEAPGSSNADTLVKARATPVSTEIATLEVGRNIYEPSKQMKQVKDDKTNGDAPAANGVPGSDSATAEEGSKKTEPVYCNQCGIDCTRIYYSSATEKDPNPKIKHELCASCFVEGRLPSNHSSQEFIRIENPLYSPVDRDGEWSQAEVVRLLEGIERYDEDWGQISEHVGSRTREECVLQFLQMDIEGKYLESELPLDAPTGLNMLGGAGGYAPFNQADNPVMSVIGFLASLADPESTAAAANTTVDTLVAGLRKRVEGVKISDSPASPPDNSNTDAKGKERGEVENRENMDIDTAAADDAAPPSTSGAGTKETTTVTTTTTVKTTRVATTTAASNTPPPTRATDRKPVEAVALAAMAGRAGGLASNEEREMTRLNSAAVNVTLQKLELKLRYFIEMEAILQAERRELERGRQQLFLDRLAFKQRVRAVQEQLKVVGAAAAGDGGDSGKILAPTAVDGFAAAGGKNGEKLGFVGPLGGVSGAGYAAAGEPQPLGGGGQIKIFEA